MAMNPIAVTASRSSPPYRAASLGLFIRENAITIDLYARTVTRSVRKDFRYCIVRRLATYFFGPNNIFYVTPAGACATDSVVTRAKHRESTACANRMRYARSAVSRSVELRGFHPGGFAV